MLQRSGQLRALVSDVSRWLGGKICHCYGNDPDMKKLTVSWPDLTKSHQMIRSDHIRSLQGVKPCQTWAICRVKTLAGEVIRLTSGWGRSITEMVLHSASSHQVEQWFTIYRWTKIFGDEVLAAGLDPPRSPPMYIDCGPCGPAVHSTVFDSPCRKVWKLWCCSLLEMNQPLASDFCVHLAGFDIYHHIPMCGVGNDQKMATSKIWRAGLTSHRPHFWSWSLSKWSWDNMIDPPNSKLCLCHFMIFCVLRRVPTTCQIVQWPIIDLPQPSGSAMGDFGRVPKDGHHRLETGRRFQICLVFNAKGMIDWDYSLGDMFN